MKPVAWIDPFDLERLPLYDSWVSGEKTKWADIPLYIHSAKTLTNEEIKSVWSKMVCSVHMTNAELQFAKAILRKAQEK
jgi:hypothetical protein